MITSNVIDKVVMILGDCGVGKTSIISSFMEYENKNEINQMSSPREKEKTICVDYFKFEKRIEDKFYRLNIWDVSGNELEDKVLPRYLYRNVDLFVLVLSLEDINSLKNLKHWIKFTEGRNLILVKNKSDLRKINEEIIKIFKEEILKNEILFEKEFQTNYKDFNSLKKLFYYFYERFSGKVLFTNEETTSEKSQFKLCGYCRKCF